MEIIRYINNKQVKEMPQINIENPTTIAILCRQAVQASKSPHKKARV